MAKNKLRYFYLDGKLHKVLHIQKAQDLVTCWAYKERKRVVYLWSDVQRKKQNAFSVGELAKMLGRHPDRIKRALKEGKINYPEQAYSLDGQYLPMAYYWSEDDAMAVHEYFSSLHIGRPRKDGRVTNNSLASVPEFRMLVKREKLLYTEEDGEFVPIFMYEDV